MRTIYVIVGFVTFALILFLILGQDFVDVDSIERLGPWAWLAVVGLMIADIFIPIPATLLITRMGQMHGVFLGGLIGTLGVFAAGVIAYWLTRLMGLRFAHWLLGDDLERTRKFFEGDGSFAVACSRWLPMLPEAISCLAGLTRMHFGKYCVALLCGAVPMSFTYAALAEVSEVKWVPQVISLVLPVPIWWFAGRLLHLRTRQARAAGLDATE